MVVEIKNTSCIVCGMNTTTSANQFGCNLCIETLSLYSASGYFNCMSLAEFFSKCGIKIIDTDVK